MRDEDGGAFRSEARPIHEAFQNGCDRVRVGHHGGGDARQRCDKRGNGTRGLHKGRKLLHDRSVADAHSTDLRNFRARAQACCLEVDDDPVAARGRRANGVEAGLKLDGRGPRQGRRDHRSSERTG